MGATFGVNNLERCNAVYAEDVHDCPAPELTHDSRVVAQIGFAKRNSQTRTNVRIRANPVTLPTPLNETALGALKRSEDVSEGTTSTPADNERAHNA